MAGFIKRALVLVAGVVLGMLIVSGSDPWHELFNRKSDPSPPAPIQRERAPDTRV